MSTQVFNPPELITASALTSGAGTIITEKFDDSKDFADGLWIQASEMLDLLANTEFVIDWERVPITTVPLMGLDGLAMAEPVLTPIDTVAVEDVGFPYSPPDPVDTTLTIDSAPEPEYTDPNFQIPDKPSVPWPIFDTDQPAIGDPDLPSKPVFTLPPVPTIEDVSIPSPPDYDLPDFTAVEPVEDLTPPDPQFVWNEAEYNSDVKDKLAETLYDELVSGGSGLDDATEQAIYDRATSRQEEEEQELYDSALNFFSSRNHMLPPGALAGGLLEADNKILRARGDLNNDILVQQSKLAQENTHFIIDRAIQNEKTLMDYANAVQTRAFEAAKFVTISALEIYKGRVEAYKAKLAVYQVQAQVYSVRIQGEIAKAEFYKAQIMGIQAGVDTKRAMVEAYRAQIGGITALIQAYATEMESARIQSEVDKNKMQSYLGAVQAYTARVGAVTAQYNAYQAEIAGEATKAEFYKAQVQAYQVMIQAYATEVDAETKIIDSKVKANDNLVEIFKGRIAEYAATVQAKVQEAEIKARNEGLKIESYKADTAKYNSELDALARTFTARVEEVKNNAQLQVQESEIAVREAVGKQGIIQENIRSSAQIASQMAAAAIAAVSASAHIGYAEGRQDSSSFAQSNASNWVNTENVSVVNQHIYSETV